MLLIANIFPARTHWVITATDTRLWRPSKVHPIRRTWRWLLLGHFSRDIIGSSRSSTDAHISGLIHLSRYIASSFYRCWPWLVIRYWLFQHEIVALLSTNGVRWDYSERLHRWWEILRLDWTLDSFHVIAMVYTAVSACFGGRSSVCVKLSNVLNRTVASKDNHGSMVFMLLGQTMSCHPFIILDTVDHLAWHDVESTSGHKIRFCFNIFSTIISNFFLKNLCNHCNFFLTRYLIAFFRYVLWGGSINRW